MKIVDEFKEFIARGNVMDMAVGIIVGGAFTAIVNSLVSNLINPLITLVTTSTSTITGGASDGATEVINGLRWAVPGTDQFIDLGAFISAVINFLIIAFVVFCLVKALNGMRERMDALAKKEADEEADEEAAAPHCPYCLEEVKAGATRCPHCGEKIEA